MEVIASGVIWGVLLAGIVVFLALLGKEEVKLKAVHRELVIDFFASLTVVLLLKAAGVQHFMFVDLNNVIHILVFLIISSMFEWGTREIIIARLL